MKISVEEGGSSVKKTGDRLVACGVPKGHHSFEGPQGAREVPNRTPPQISVKATHPKNFRVECGLKNPEGG